MRHRTKFPRLRGAGRWITLLGAIIGASATAAFGADPASTASKAPVDRGYDWSGAYFGGHVGYGTGRFDAELREPEIGAPIQKRDTLGSLYAGAHIGYNFLISSRILLGAEADVSFPNYLGTDDIVSFAVSPVGHVAEKPDFLGSVRGRLGYAFGHWLWYGTGGLALTLDFLEPRLAAPPFQSVGDVVRGRADHVGRAAQQVAMTVAVIVHRIVEIMRRQKLRLAELAGP